MWIPSRARLVSAERGVAFASGTELFQARPVARKSIARWPPGVDGLRVERRTVLLQVDGQRYGLIGRPAIVGEAAHGMAASWHLARVVADRPAWLYAFFRSEIGRRATVRLSYGTSVPAISARPLRSLRIPAMPQELEAKAQRALELRESADANEATAIRKVEKWLAS